MDIGPAVFVWETCDVVLSILRQIDNSSALPLIRRVNITRRCHHRSMSHQLFDLHHVNTSIRQASTEHVTQVMNCEVALKLAGPTPGVRLGKQIVMGW
jgi:hypothetical protein